MRRVRRGFTLIEVVLAVALSLALVVAMLAFYEQVVDVRAKVRAEAQIVSEEQKIMDLMTQDLRSAFVLPAVSMGVDGATLQQIRMVTVGLPGGMSWVAPSMMGVTGVATGDLPPPQGDLQIIGYRLRIEQDDQGQTAVTGLERTCQRTPTLETAVEGDEHGLTVDGTPADIFVTPLTFSIRFLRLRYWDGSAWQDSWSSGDLPGAVEIILGRDVLPDGSDPADYPGTTFRRMVAIPAGVKPPTGTIITGLGTEGGLP
jgi:prepilin-type N-terminal cleavage/methylation domain-containing protein